jgi:hypothetical protein
MVHRHIDEIVVLAITDLIYVRFTNSEASPMMIDYYAVEIRKPNGKWQKAVCLNRLNGTLFMRGSINEGCYMTLDEPLFDNAIKNVNIPANGGSVKGWLIIERPEGFDGADENRQWRLYARDINGNQGYSTITQVAARRFDETLSDVGFKVDFAQRKDISKYRAMYYSGFLGR